MQPLPRHHPAACLDPPLSSGADPLMSPRAEEALELHSLKEILYGYVCSEAGRLELETLNPSPVEATVKGRLCRVGEMRRVLQESPFPLAPFCDLRIWLPRLKEGGEPLEPKECLEVSEVIEGGEAARRHLVERKNLCPTLSGEAPDLRGFPRLRAEIKEAIGPDAEVADRASPELARVRLEIRTLKVEIRKTLEGRMGDWASFLQEPLVLIRRDRYVVPVRQGFKKVLQGVILDQSASGATLYVEPTLIQGRNDRLAELRAAEVAEVYRILARLTAKVFSEKERLAALVGWLAGLDAVRAVALFSEDFDCSEPFLEEDGGLCLLNARHPILERQKGQTGTVPLSLKLGQDERQLVITGANTGGKTIALKTLGLLSLMAQSGFPIPASEGSRLPLFDQIFADIGDEQSIAQSLSTFSAHLQNQVEILQGSTRRSLVLIDELGAGTDPTEGAALGVAVLETLAEKGVHVIVTTHHDAIKAYGYEAQGAVNASVEFDEKTLRPTYRLLAGVAGTSNAITVAERLGMPSRVTGRARVLEEGSGDGSRPLIQWLEAKLTDLQREKEELAQAREVLGRDREALTQETKHLVERRQKFSRRTEEFMREARQHLRVLDRSSRRAERGEETLPAGEAREMVWSLERVGEEALAAIPESERQVSGPIRVGGRVVLVGTGLQGKVLEGPNPKGEWCIEMGGKRIWAHEKGLTALEGPSQGTGRQSAEDQGLGWSGPGRESPALELHVRGERVDEALTHVDKYLDEAALSGMPFIRIVHGKGTGTLKAAISDVLQGHPLVKTFYTAGRESGGAGVTVVEMV